MKVVQIYKNMDIKIKSMGREHLNEVCDLEYLCFSVPWTRGMFEEELSISFAVYYVAEAEGKVSGYAGIHIVADEGNITKIAVHPDMRRMGIANKLLEQIINSAERVGVKYITLEVRESNEPARALYSRFGFTDVGRRRGYYIDPPEDAIIMAVVSG